VLAARALASRDELLLDVPFVTATEFIESIRAGREAAERLESSHAPQPHAPEQVAEAILDLVRTGAEQADLVPEEFGGSFRG
jgi:hypothetical protein